MINYKVLTEELLALLAPFNFHHENGHPKSNDDVACQQIIDSYTPDRYRTWLKKQVDQIAKDKRNTLFLEVSPFESSSWGLKLLEAQKFQAGENLPSDALLVQEAQQAGITLDALVNRVLLNAMQYKAWESAIGGAARKHKDTLESLGTWESLLAYDVTQGW